MNLSGVVAIYKKAQRESRGAFADTCASEPRERPHAQRCVRGHTRVHAYQFGYILGEYKKKKRGDDDGDDDDDEGEKEGKEEKKKRRRTKKKKKNQTGRNTMAQKPERGTPTSQKKWSLE